MPTYVISMHSTERARERFADVGPLTADGRAWVTWLQRLAQEASAVKADQGGMDLLLRAVVAGPDDTVAVYLAVTPLGGHDRWLVRTVLTPAQVRANLRAHHRDWQQACRQRWKARRFDRQREWAA